MPGRQRCPFIRLTGEEVVTLDAGIAMSFHHERDSAPVKKSLWRMAAYLFVSLMLRNDGLANSLSSARTQEPPTLDGAKRQAATAFARMPIDQVQAQLLQWLATAKVETAIATQVTAKWADRSTLSQLTAEESLDLVIDSLGLADATVKEMIESCRRNGAHPTLNLEGARSEPFFRDAVQLYYARWLTQHRFYDEAMPLLEAMNPETSIDPASLFFYRSVCRLRLLKPAEAADDLTLLLENTLDVPARYRTVAELMKAEAATATEGLPQVARLMSDVQRRLDLGKSDDPVQKREEEVIAALDKLLEDMEKQQQQQQQQQQNSGQGGGQQQNQPSQQGAAQSTIKGSAGNGDADRKELSENGNWGMLDQQSETQAKELIRQKLPPNFLDAIGRYTRKIAEQKK